MTIYKWFPEGTVRPLRVGDIRRVLGLVPVEQLEAYGFKDGVNVDGLWFLRLPGGELSVPVSGAAFVEQLVADPKKYFLAGIISKENLTEIRDEECQIKAEMANEGAAPNSEERKPT